VKYTVFIIGIIFLVPLGSLAATYSRRVREIAFGCLVFATVLSDWYDINFVDRWWYAGSTRGFEVSIVDLLTITLLLSTIATLRREGGRLFWPAGLGPMIAFLAFGCFSVAISDPKLFGLFELTKLVRGIVVFLTVAWYVRTERDAYVLVVGLGGALLCNGAFAVWQRYSGAMYRVHGTFPHENILGDYCVLAGPIVLAVGLSALPPMVRAYCVAASVSAAVATVLTISRMPSALFLGTSMAVLVTAFGFRFTPRKVALVLLVGVLLIGIFYRGLDGLSDRQRATTMADDSQGDGRTGHYRMGWKMALDHPVGVGLNNWGWYYHEYASWAGVDNSIAYESTSAPGEGRATQGHTLYGLTLGELGWPGVILFMILVARCLHIGVSFLLVSESNIWSRIGVGCFFGFLAEFVANSTEITFRNQQIFIIFNILLGFLAVARMHVSRSNWMVATVNRIGNR